MKIYQAPWGKSLIAVSSLLVVLAVANVVVSPDKPEDFVKELTR